ncbi:MAG: RagB/SusD family nutrient uptake outer membrane protein [Anditalea sp.]
MKNYKLNIILSLFAVSLYSCEDLETVPQQSLSTELAFSDRQAVEGSLLGVYSLTQEFDVHGSLPQVIADYQSDNVNFIGSFPTLQSINDFSTQADNSNVATLWRYHYRAILAANAVIKFTPTSPDATLSEEERNQFVAEAKFVRALLMFQMANLFAHPIQVGGESAEGIPIVLEPYEGEIVNFPRSSVGEVHAQIKQDLEDAVPHLPVDYSTPDFTRGRATVGAAKALLSRLHLYREEWQQAADLAEEVLDSELYAVAPNYGFWGENGPEYVFSVQNSEIDNGRTGSGGWGEYYNPASAGARGDAPFSSYLIEAYEEEADDRRFSELTQVGDNGMVYTTKFPDFVTHSDNSPVIRSTEVALNLAEALAQIEGVNDESLAILNQLRTRAGLPSVSAADFSNPESFIDFILNERRKELAFEGHRRMDLLRYELPLRPETDPRFEASQPGADKTILPIPQRERDINPELSQNQGY